VSARMLLAPLLTVLVAAAHPSHTSTAELVARADSVQVAIRLFTDDLAGTGDLRSYVAERFAIVDGRGAPVALEWIGSRRVRDVVVVRLRGRTPAGLAGATVRHELLMERFADQVNVVRAKFGGRSTTLVFVRGDAPKALPGVRRSG
jgi:hypothetical protein